MANLVEMKLVGDLSKSLDKLQTSVQGEVALSGVAAMAKVIYDEARMRAPVANAPHNGRGGKTYQPGTLRDAIYRAYSPERSNHSEKTYRISWNKKKAGTGYWMEYGYWRKYEAVQLKNGDWITLKDRPLAAPVWMPPQPFLRPAFDRMDAAINAGRIRMAQKFREIAL